MRRGRPRKGTLVETTAGSEDPLNELVTTEGLDAVDFFLQGARRYALLTADQEKELGKRILEQGDEKAVETLVNHNLRLAPWIAFKYRRKSRVPVSDMIQEGVLGLMTAARKYDYRRGNRFSTYATWWVRQAIVRSVMNDGRMIRLPVHFQEFCMQVLDASMEVALDVVSTNPEKIAKHMGVNVERVRKALLYMQTNFVSLDEPVNAALGDDGLTLGETLVSGTFLSPEQVLTAKKELEFVTRWVQLVSDTVKQEVSERDFRVFQSYYGLNSAREKKSQGAIAEEAGVQRSTVSQIIKSIWKKLKEFQKHFDEKTFTQHLQQIATLEDLAGMEVDFQEVKEAEFRIRLSTPWCPSTLQ